MTFSLIFALIVLALREVLLLYFMDSYGSINESYAQTSQHGFPLPKADLAVTEFLKHEKTEEWWVSDSSNVSQWSSQVIGTPPIISDPFHCRGDKVLILLRYSSTLDIDLPSCLHYFGQKKYAILYRKYALLTKDSS